MFSHARCITLTPNLDLDSLTCLILSRCWCSASFCHEPSSWNATVAPSPWQPLCLWHQYHHSTANGRGRERMRALTLWNPVVLFKRRCNLCNLGDYACQDERNDFWSNKQVKHSHTPLLVALKLILLFVIRASWVHFITALMWHVGLSAFWY